MFSVFHLWNTTPNQVKHILFVVLLVMGIFLCASIMPSWLYHGIMGGIGGWQLGGWLKTYCDKNYPLTDNKED